MSISRPVVVSAAAPRSACLGNVVAHRKTPASTSTKFRNSELALHVRIEAAIAKVLRGAMVRTSNSNSN